MRDALPHRPGRARCLPGEDSQGNLFNVLFSIMVTHNFAHCWLSGCDERGSPLDDSDRISVVGVVGSTPGMPGSSKNNPEATANHGFSPIPALGFCTFCTRLPLSIAYYRRVSTDIFRSPSAQKQSSSAIVRLFPTVSLGGSG